MTIITHQLCEYITIHCIRKIMLSPLTILFRQNRIEKKKQPSRKCNFYRTRQIRVWIQSNALLYRTFRRFDLLWNQHQTYLDVMWHSLFFFFNRLNYWTCIECFLFSSTKNNIALIYISGNTYRSYTYITSIIQL